MLSIKLLTKIQLANLFSFLFFDNSELPLVLYVFSMDSKIQELFCKHTRAGSMCINDTMMQYVGKKMLFKRHRRTSINGFYDFFSAFQLNRYRLVVLE